jgi:hypothetical protein
MLARLWLLLPANSSNVKDLFAAHLWNLKMKRSYILWVNVLPVVSKLKGLVRVVSDLYHCLPADRDVVTAWNLGVLV